MRAVLWTALLLIGGLFAVALIGPGPGPSQDKTPERLSASDALPTGKPTVIPESMRARIDARKQISVEKMKPKRSNGNLIEITAVLKNSGSVDVKDVDITCTYMGGSGTVIDKNTKTVYDIVPAGKSINVRGLVMGIVHDQTNSMDCSVSDLKLR